MGRADETGRGVMMRGWGWYGVGGHWMRLGDGDWQRREIEERLGRRDWMRFETRRDEMRWGDSSSDGEIARERERE